MIKSSATLHSSPESTGLPWRLLRYLVLGIAINAGIWSLTFFYLKVTKPTYVSKWTLVLPETGSSTKVDIPEVGGASSEVKSPYSDRAQDPRAKYQVIATSDVVLEAAATKLNIPAEKFGKPRIKVVDNSTLIDFEIQGNNREEARNKALALQEAFDNRLKQLRNQETTLQDSSVQKSLAEAKQKLEIAQKRLAEFKAKTGLGSKAQLDHISEKMEELRKQYAEFSAQKQQAGANLKALSTNLNLSAKQASDAFALKTDSVFQQYLKAYSDAASNLAILNSKFLPTHPAVISENSKQASAQAAMQARSQSLLGRPISLGEIAQLNLNGTTSTGSAREMLLQELVQVQAESQAREASTRELNSQIAGLDARYRIMTQNALTLDTLERDVRIAETIFSSALTELNIGKVRAGSYPPLQVLIAPSLPPEAAAPKKSFALLGAALGSLLISTALFSLWLRPYLLRKRQPSKSNLVKSPHLEVAPLQSTDQLGALNLQEEKNHKGERSRASVQ